MIIDSEFRLIIIFFYFVGAIIFLVPFLFMLFGVLKKCGVGVSNKLRNFVSIVVPLIIAVVFSARLVSAPYRVHSYSLSGVEIPVNIVDFEYPDTDLSLPNDMPYGAVYHMTSNFELEGGFDLEILDSLCNENNRYWSKKDGQYFYDSGYSDLSEEDLNDDWEIEHVEVTIDSISRNGCWKLWVFYTEN